MYNQGVRKGTHVALWASNSSKWVFIYLAIQRIGAIAVLINVAFKWRELERILSFYDVEYIYYTKMYRDSDHQNTIEMLDRSKFPLLKSAVLIDEECIDVNMLAKHSGFVSPVQINADDTCSILFTSGTTGSSKGVMLSHKNIVNNAKDIDDRMGWNKDDRMCIAVPLFHCFGITVGILGSIHIGASMNIVRAFTTRNVFEMIENKKCTVFNGVPTMFLTMMNSSKREKFDLSTLKGGLMAGSSILPPL